MFNVISVTSGCKFSGKMLRNILMAPYLNVSVYCRLLATHYPHLCLVEDCLDEELSALALPPAVVCRPGKLSCTVNNLQQG